MAASPQVEFKNKNYITDNDPDYDDESSFKPVTPKKNIKASFDLVHPVLEEEKLELERKIEEQKLAIEKTQGSRFDRYKVFLYGISLLGLFFFSYKRWFPLIRNPFF